MALPHPPGHLQVPREREREGYAHWSMSWPWLYSLRKPFIGGGLLVLLREEFPLVDTQ